MFLSEWPLVRHRWRKISPINASATLANFVTNFRAIDKNWMFVPAGGAPSSILDEVEPDEVSLLHKQYETT